ncbi:MAG: SCO family protein [Alphaproteobacteria bacterium]
MTAVWAGSAHAHDAAIPQETQPGKSASGAATEALVHVGGAFVLTDHTGRRVTDKDFLGRYMLVFFGYTFCPDVCPTELALMAATLDLLGKDAGKIQPVFITIDPGRDDVAALAEYVPLFHPGIIGLTGSEEEIDRVVEAYKVIREKVSAPDGYYLMRHSASTYLMGPDGEFIGSIDFMTPVEDAAAAIREVMRDDAM